MESSSFWNPESTVLESGIQYSESRIQDCPGFPYMGRLQYQSYKVCSSSVAKITVLVSCNFCRYEQQVKDR